MWIVLSSVRLGYVFCCANLIEYDTGFTQSCTCLTIPQNLRIRILMRTTVHIFVWWPFGLPSFSDSRSMKALPTWVAKRVHLFTYACSCFASPLAWMWKRGMRLLVKYLKMILIIRVVGRLKVQHCLVLFVDLCNVICLGDMQHCISIILVCMTSLLRHTRLSHWHATARS